MPTAGTSAAGKLGPVRSAAGKLGAASGSAAPRGLDTPAGTSVEELVRSGISAARAAAFAVLKRVASSDAHSDDLLHGEALAGLAEVDRHLATALVLQTLRWQIALDARLAGLLARPEAELGLPARIALRLGAVQLLHFDRLPAHAAVHESVELVRAVGHGHASGMVNAVLRRLTREPAPGRKLHETVAALAERLGHPGWLVERWVKTYGRPTALAVCEYDQREAAAGGLFVDPAEGDDPDVADVSVPPLSMRSVSPGPLSPLPSEIKLPSLPRMDDGSRLVAELAAAAAPPAGFGASGQSLRAWDCCAAPGGKSLVLARRFQEQGIAAELLLTDLSLRRVKALQAQMIREFTRAEPGDALRKAGQDTEPSGVPQPPPHRLLGVEVVQADAAQLPESFGEFDLILCDVPCSGTGTLARNPEIRHRLRPADLARQAARQRAILAGALRRLRPGGRLVYSTCSLEPEENEAVVAEVLGAVPDGAAIAARFGRVDAGPLLGTIRLARELPAVVREGCLRTLPGANFAGDGFFAAVLERVS